MAKDKHDSGTFDLVDHIARIEEARLTGLRNSREAAVEALRMLIEADQFSYNDVSCIARLSFVVLNCDCELRERLATATVLS